MKLASVPSLHRAAFALLAPLAAFCLLSVPATLAQTTKVFVASYGNDANDGSRAAPKRNFQPAHDAVTNNGQIVVLDTAGYGALSISKSVSITVPPGVNGFVTTTGDNNAITINAQAAQVSLRGLIIEGGGGGIGSGVNAINVGVLRVEDCIVRNFYRGIYLNSSVFPAQNPARLSVSGSSIRDVGYGVVVQLTISSFEAEALVSDCSVDNASVAALSVQCSATFSTASMTARSCTLTHNALALSASGSAAFVFADDCALSGNTTGVDAGTGSIYTRTNNVFTNNSSADGTFTSAFAAK